MPAGHDVYRHLHGERLAADRHPVSCRLSTRPDRSKLSLIFGKSHFRRGDSDQPGWPRRAAATNAAKAAFGHEIEKEKARRETEEKIQQIAGLPLNRLRA
jgi:hypothetical protein